MHLNHTIVDIELERFDEPGPKLAERQTMAHRQGPRTNEALPARPQPQAFDRPADRIWPVEHPYCLALYRCSLEDVAQRRDERVNAATQVLQIDQHHVEAVRHRGGWPTHLAVQAEDRDAVQRILEIRRLDHVVLLVAAQPVLRSESGRDVELAAGEERVERMRQVDCDRGGMREQRYAFAGKRRAQGGLAEESIDAELHGRNALGQFDREAIGMMKIRLAGRVAQGPVGLAAVHVLDQG